jgi:UV excision repair protein RAD23
MSAPAIKLKIRTVKNVACDVELTTDKTIADVKKAIETTYNHPVGSQRLIFSGKVLEDDKTIGSYNIESNKMVVLYLKDPAPAAAPATPAQTTSGGAQTPNAPARATGGTAGGAVAQTPASPTQMQTQSGTTASQPAAAQGPVNNTSMTTAEFAEAIQNIVDMGFDRNEAVRALNAAYGDSARAVEYIVSGNIPNINQLPPLGANQGAQAQNRGAAGNQGAAAGNQGGNQGGGAAAAAQGNPNSPFAQLRQLPQFQGIIALIQQNPALLEPLLQQLAERDPGIVELIRENREEFLQILQQPVDPNVLQALQAAAAEEGFGDEEFGEDDLDDEEQQLAALGVQTGGGAGAARRPAGIPPGAQVIQITPAEKEAIDRLVALGFDRQRALEAFLVCNKDEEMAANYLFEQGD